MNGMTFTYRVKKEFGYLEFDYGFRVTHESNSEVRSQTDGAGSTHPIPPLFLSIVRQPMLQCGSIVLRMVENMT